MKNAFRRSRLLARRPWYPWAVVIVLTVASTISYIDRSIINLMVGPIRRDLGISDTQMSFLMGPAFAFAYALVTIPMGWLADRYPRKNLIAIGVFAWSIVTALSGLARNYGELMAARMGVGVGEASLGPAAYSMISDFFPQERLALALAVFSSAPFIGVGLANIFGGVLIDYFETFATLNVPVIGEVRSWQATFFIVGLPGALLAIVVFALREPLRGRYGRRIDQADTDVPFSEVLSFMAARWQFFVLQFSSVICLSIMGYAVFAWAPELFQRVFGVSRSVFGLTYGTIAIVFGIAGAYVAGAIVPSLMKRGYSDAVLRVVIFAACLVCPLAVLYPQLSNTYIAFAILAVVTFVMAMPTGMVTASIQSVTPTEIRAQVISIYLFVVFTAGFTLGPVGIGVLNDFVFKEPMGIKNSMSVLALVTYPAAAIQLLICLRYFRKAIESMDEWRPRGALVPAE